MSAFPLTAILLVASLAGFSYGRSVLPQQYNISQQTSGTINASSGTQNIARVGSTSAFPTPLSTSKCHRFYNHSGSLCNYSIPADALLFANENQQRTGEYKLKSVRIQPEFFRNTLPNPATLLRKRCFQIIQDMYCHHYFPLCDVTSSNPQPQPICREACEMLNFMCKSAWLQLMRNYPGVTWYAQYEIGENKDYHETFRSYKRKKILMKCNGLPQMDGADIPECYIPKVLLYGKTMMEIDNGTSRDCYYGNGYAYRGNISYTKSGFKCQSWSGQYPQRHFRTPDKYKELAGAGNACRNPGHQAPLGPWCYTTHSLVRWEYCNVTVCQQADTKNASRMTINASNNVRPKVIKG